MKKEQEEKDSRTGVLGMGNTGNKEEATAWLNEKLTIITNTKPDIYTKGDFKGLLFANFESKKLRDSSVESFRKASFSRDGSRCWASEDAPVEERACKALLFGIKNQMIEWGWGKFELWVDVKNFSISCLDDRIASVSVSSKQELQIDYGIDWQSYLSEGNLADLIKRSSDMLKNSVNRQAGKGKGKQGGKGKLKSKKPSSHE